MVARCNTLDEATLHLTVGVNNPTGADLLSWFVNRLRASEDVRRDLPRFESREHRLAWMERLRDEMVNAWTPELMDDYLADLDARSQPRPRMNLPWSATPDALPSGSSFKVRWISPRIPTLRCSNGEVHVTSQGRRWRFASAAAPLLQKLLSGQSCSVAELATGDIPESTAYLFVRELAVNGLVAVV